MPRRLLALAATGLVLACAPAAQARTYDVPKLLAKQVQSARTRSGISVLLPSTINAPLRVYPEGSSSKGRYDLSLGFAKGCHEATACFFAAFLGERTRAKPVGDAPVTLAGGRRGAFTATHCGASCAAPQVQWRQGGALYTLQAKLATKHEKAALVALANSAIRAGAR